MKYPSGSVSTWVIRSIADNAGRTYILGTPPVRTEQYISYFKNAEIRDILPDGILQKYFQLNRLR
jgi:hypothetical protein